MASSSLSLWHTYLPTIVLLVQCRTLSEIQPEKIHVVFFFLFVSLKFKVLAPVSIHTDFNTRKMKSGIFLLVPVTSH